MATRIDGKALAAKVKAQVAAEAAQAGPPAGAGGGAGGGRPRLAGLCRGKKRTAGSAAFAAWPYRPAGGDHPGRSCWTLIEQLNRDPEVDGILVQLPLPEPLDEAAVHCWPSPRTRMWTASTPITWGG